jgi:hypothetical protein
MKDAEFATRAAVRGEGMRSLDGAADHGQTPSDGRHVDSIDSIS